jgi:cation diffusion facilitator family transporter
VTTAAHNPLRASTGYGRDVQRVLWITLVLNFAVSLAKLVVGLATHSLTLVSDAAHSAIDGVNNIVGLVAVGVASKEADADHPYGHSKFETLAAFVLSGLLFFTCFEIAVSAARRLFGGHESTPVAGPVSFAVAVGTLLVNLGVSRYEGRRGRELDSDFLIADAAHTRSDVLVTATVITSLVFVRLGFERVDAALSLVIAVFIGRIGYGVFRRTLPVLVDASAVDESQVQKIVRAVPGVRSAHAVRSRRVGSTVFLEMHLVVEPTDTETAHARTEAVETALERSFGPTRATIHVETSRDCGL